MDVEAQSSLIVRCKGALAFLPDKVWHFPCDNQHYSDASEKNYDLTRNKKRKKQPAGCLDEYGAVPMATATYVSQSSAVALLLVDYYQISSRRYIDLLTRRVMRSRSVVAVFVGTTPLDHDTAAFWRGSGVALVPQLGDCQAFLSHALAWSSCPALAVVETARGRKISVAAEEIALEDHQHEKEKNSSNNKKNDDDDDDPVLLAWQSGKSALSWVQRATAALFVPSVQCNIL